MTYTTVLKPNLWPITLLLLISIKDEVSLEHILSAASVVKFIVTIFNYFPTLIGLSPLNQSPRQEAAFHS